MATLKDLIEAMEHIAPLAYAEPWDNVGLIVEPPEVGDIGAVMLTIDLTERVFAEAMESGADAIVAYHPPIFGELRTLRQDRGLSRTLMAAVRAGIPVYSPHTALDVAKGGMSDWLADGLGHAESSAPIRGYVGPDGPEPHAGVGRQVVLTEAAPLQVLVETLKAHLGLQHLRVAAPADLQDETRWVSSAGICPGAGGKVFESLGAVDLLVTGELSHHQVLARVGAGTAVILTGHSNSERGYLPRLKSRLARALGEGVEVMVSKRDQDPLRVR